MPWFEFSSPVVLTVRGRDASRYLQARLTNDIQNLALHTSCIAAALTPQGKLQAVVTVLHTKGVSPQEREFILYSETGDRTETHNALKRFIVADRVEIEECSAQWRLIHTTEPSFVGNSAPLEENQISLDEALTQIAIARRRFAIPGRDLLVRTQASGSISDLLRTSSFPTDDYLRHRIRTLSPLLPGDIGEELLFSEAPLGNAVSYTKGCYAGQEVVERIASQGKSPRVLVGISIEGIEPLGSLAVVHREGTTENTIGTCYQPVIDIKTNTTLAFAVIKNRGPYNELFVQERRAVILT